jgi:hypothetical protein
MVETVLGLTFEKETNWCIYVISTQHKQFARGKCNDAMQLFELSD